MVRRAALALMIFCLAGSSSMAQEWAKKMFKESAHDFGNVARGAKAEYRFKFQNIYEEPVHVVSVRSTCGCTTPSITKNDLKTYETSEIVAKFNTPLFTGYKSATVTVTIDKPFFAEVQLQVSGNIRTEISVDNPGFVQLGTVDHKAGTLKKVSVRRTGKRDWKITDVRSANTNFEVDVVEASRSPSQVVYDLNVRLKPEAPVGYIKDQLILLTNDSSTPQFPVDVEGVVVSQGVTVTPSSLSMGALERGEKVTKKVAIAAKKPFKILDIKSNDSRFSFQMPNANDPPKLMYLVSVTFAAGDDPGKIADKINIVTDLPKENTADLSVHAQVLDTATTDKTAEK